VQIARRLYIYFIAAVSLAMLAVGLMSLLRIGLEQIAIALGWSEVILEPGEAIRRQISLWAAVSIVALPVWLLHWWLAERAALRPDADGEAERGSTVRALYLSAVLAGSFLAAFFAGTTLVQRLLGEALGVPGPTGSLAGPLDLVVVSASIWVYHAGVRRGDAAAVEMRGAAAWAPRLYRYAAAFIGALQLLFELGTLFRLIIEVLLPRETIVPSDDWWRGPLAGGVASVVVGLLAWAGHWGVSLELLRQPGWRGLSERASVLRRAYLYVMILVGVVATLVFTAVFLNEAFAWVLGVIPRPAGDALARRLLDPLARALPFAAAWAYHRWIVLAEAASMTEVPRQASVRRIYTYGVAFVGLGFGSVGLAYLLGLLLDAVLGGTRVVTAPPDWWRRQVALFVALTLVGTGAWLWHWYMAARRVSADPADERGATTRRVYLFATLAASLVAVLVSLAVTLYRILTVLLGVGSARGLVSDVSAALGVFVVAAALLAYHGIVLRDDLRERRAEAAAEKALPLLLTGPPDADLSGILDDLRERLPEGYTLRPFIERE